MPTDASKAESSRSRLVAAVAATEAERTARVSRRRFSEPPLPLARDLSAGADEGVTDFALRRTRVAAVDQSGADALTDLMTERWPWLESLDEDDGCDDTESLGSLYAGTSRYFRYGEVWSLIAEGDPAAARRAHDDPVWIAEVLRYVDETWPRAGAVVRGAQCAHFAFRVDLNAHRDEVEIPPFRPYSRPPRLTGEVAIDEHGRIRQVTWTEIPRGRARGPTAVRRTGRLWQTTELWDFGLPVDIQLPSTPPGRERPWPVDLAGIAWRLWRARRGYRRAHGTH